MDHMVTRGILTKRWLLGLDNAGRSDFSKSLKSCIIQFSISRSCASFENGEHLLFNKRMCSDFFVLQSGNRF